MAVYDEKGLQELGKALEGLDIRHRKMFGCICIYCDDQPVGWLGNGLFSLRETGLTNLPPDLKRPAPEASMQEIPIKPERFSEPWFWKAVQDTAQAIRRRGGAGKR